MLENIQADMRNGVASKIDSGVRYGRSACTGNAVPNVTFVNQTTNRAPVGSGDLADEVLAGYDLAVAGNPNGDPNGFAFDSTYRTRIARAGAVSNTVGATIPAIPSLTGAGTTLGGLPVAGGRPVSGRVGDPAAEDPKGSVGDCDTARHWGSASSSALKRSDQAT